MAGKGKTGPAPYYTEPIEMQKRIDEYFKECEGKPLLDAKGNPVFDKFGNPIIIGKRPLTITGLALSLGFATRLSLTQYMAKPEFKEMIEKAKSKVEQYAEERLFDKDGANGAKFSLANNFKGWKEKQSIEADIKQDITINISLEEDE